MGGDCADVAILKVVFRSPDLVLWEMVNGEPGHLRLDPAHWLDEGGVGSQVAIAFPLHGHFPDLPLEALGAEEARGDVCGIAAALIVVEDLLQMVHAGEVVACANAVAIALDLDHVEHVLRCVETRLVG